MSPEQAKEASSPLPGSEGLKPLSWSGASKYELQVANDLFEELAKDPKNPQVLWKINALRLDIMKRAAEAEISKLEPKTTRAQIEAEMTKRQVSKAEANDTLAYVLVTYLQNVEKLAAARTAEKGAVTATTRVETGKLKTDVRADETSKAETVVVPTEKTAAPKTAKQEGAKPGPETGTSAPTEESKSASFIKERRSEIDALIAKLPEGETKSKFARYVDKPTKENVAQLQSDMGLKSGKNGADGQFGKITLATLKKFVENGGKKVEAPSGSVAAPKAPSWEKPKPKADKAAEAEAARAAEADAAAERDMKAKEAAELARNEKELDALQEKVLTNLKPLGNDTYVVKTQFSKDGATGAAFFKFDVAKGEWLWNAFNNPDYQRMSRWDRVARLEQATVEGKTQMSLFGGSPSTQETFNAIFEAQKRSRELDLPLKSPSAPSPIVQMIPQ